jgi:hypothetical protein
MTTHSKSCITHSLPEAERMVDQLRAARFSPDEISMLVPVETPVPGTAPHDGGQDREHDGSDSGDKDILVSVHLEGGCGMSRAEEIFGRASSEGPPPVPCEDESPHSWVKSLLASRLR